MNWLKVLADFFYGLWNYNTVPRRDRPGIPQVPAGIPVPVPRPPVVLSAAPPPEVALRGWSKDISDCHILIQQAFPLVASEFTAMHPDCELRCDYTYRSPAFQMELFKKGRKLVGTDWVIVDKNRVVTKQDGKRIKSHHNVYPSQAADFYIVRAGNIVWTDPDLYSELGRIWVRHGLVSGAVWRFDWKDYDHVQVAYGFV